MGSSSLAGTAVSLTALPIPVLDPVTMRMTGPANSLRTGKTVVRTLRLGCADLNNGATEF
jgi:hypothetical protein